jgi:hypothetical protein
MMKKRHIVLAAALVAAVAATAAFAATFSFRSAKPAEYDPVHSTLVNAAWLEGSGCPSNAIITTDGVSPTLYPAANCAGGDASDTRNEGLVFVKSGPTANYAEPFVELKVSKDAPVTEVGYDLRKPGADTSDVRGSQCSADAPMFQFDMSDGHTYYVACTSPAPTSQTPVGIGWLRLRWSTAGHVLGYQDGVTLMPIPGTIVHGYIVFQEGQDGGPNNFGLAVIDNIDLNGSIVGQGAASPSAG